MTNLYIVDSGDGDEERARRAAEREAECRRLRRRYAQHLAARAALDELTAQRVVAVLFDPRHSSGERCECDCHPQLTSDHGDGFDCRCTWDEARLAEEHQRWRELPRGEADTELRRLCRREEASITAWLAGQPGVDATRTTWICPEQWEGTVDGHAFCFRERHGMWRIEVEGEIIAEGRDTQLGAIATEHIAFIVGTIRGHLRGC